MSAEQIDLFAVERITKPNDCSGVAGDDEAAREEQRIAVDAAFEQVQEDVKIALDLGVRGSLTALLQNTDRRLLVPAVSSARSDAEDRSGQRG